MPICALLPSYLVGSRSRWDEITAGRALHVGLEATATLVGMVAVPAFALGQDRATEVGRNAVYLDKACTTSTKLLLEQSAQIKSQNVTFDIGVTKVCHTHGTVSRLTQCGIEMVHLTVDACDIGKVLNRGHSRRDGIHKCELFDLNGCRINTFFHIAVKRVGHHFGTYISFFVTMLHIT